jgi:hypothetical protein
MQTQEIVINDAIYEVKGDYPDGKYQLSPKDKGASLKNKNTVLRQTKIDLSKIDWDKFVSDDTGKVLATILCKIFNTNLDKLKKMGGKDE